MGVFATQKVNDTESISKSWYHMCTTDSCDRQTGIQAYGADQKKHASTSEAQCKIKTSLDKYSDAIMT